VTAMTTDLTRTAAPALEGDVHQSTAHHFTYGTDLEFVRDQLNAIDPIDVESEDPSDVDYEIHRALNYVRAQITCRLAVQAGPRHDVDFCGVDGKYGRACGPELGLPQCAWHGRVVGGLGDCGAAAWGDRGGRVGVGGRGRLGGGAVPGVCGCGSDCLARLPGRPAPRRGRLECGEALEHGGGVLVDQLHACGHELGHVPSVGVERLLGAFLQLVVGPDAHGSVAVPVAGRLGVGHEESVPCG